jgi:hypothetical protein
MRAMDWFFDPGGEVGGEDTPHAYLLIFAIGVVVGSVIRLGMYLLPRGPVDRLRERLLPDPPKQSDDGDPTR